MITHLILDEQKVFAPANRKNKIQTIVSPLGTSDEGIKIIQQAYFSLLDLDEGQNVDYEQNQAKNGTYILFLTGR